MIPIHLPYMSYIFRINQMQNNFIDKGSRKREAHLSMILRPYRL